MLASWLRTPLLILAALALASMVAEPRAQGAGGEAEAAASSLIDPALQGSLTAPDHPVRLAAVRALVGARIQGGRAADDLAGDDTPPAGGQGRALRPGVPATGLRVARRFRLGFAHLGALARTGAYSSFGTSLPPPLSA